MIRFPAFFRIIILRAFSCVLYTISLCQQEFLYFIKQFGARIHSPICPRDTFRPCILDVKITSGSFDAFDV
jgi:hypothetical protein